MFPSSTIRMTVSRRILFSIFLGIALIVPTAAGAEGIPDPCNSPPDFIPCPPPPDPGITVTTSDVNAVATQGIAATITLDASASDSSEITYSIVTGPANGTLGSISGNSVQYTSGGSFTGIDTFTYKGVSGSEEDEGTVTITVSAAVSQATLTVRSGATILWSGTVDLPGGTVALTPTAGGDSHSVPANSVTGVLAAADAAQTAFDITDLQYFSSFGSFYVNCISTFCSNWQFAVNGVTPGSGMDSVTLSNGDVVYVYFGNARRISSNVSTFTTNSPFVLTAESYVAASDSWTPAVGYHVGVVQGDSFSPTVISSALVDSAGNATLSISTPGTYGAGISEDFYFPTIPLTVLAQTSSGGSSQRSFSVPRALTYLSTVQNPDGSFETPLLSDWAALTFSAADPGIAKSRLKEYLTSATPTMSNIADYERHAMALLALGINPYSVAGKDYINPIVASFDGTQIGDASLVNDDIFALFPLTHTGYGAGDPIIQKVTAFIVSKQAANGSWENSTDLTAAAVQALSLVRALPGASGAIVRAEGLLRSKQEANGGFSNSFSTSWTMQAISALGQSPGSWIPGMATPEDYLAGLQQADGGAESSSASTMNRAWATEYAIVGVLGKTWDSLLSSFPRTAPVLPTPAPSPASTTPEVIASAPAFELSPNTQTFAAQNPITPARQNTPRNVRESVVDEAEATSTAPAPVEPASIDQFAAAGSVDTTAFDWTWLLILLGILALIALTATTYSFIFRKDRR